MSVGCSQRRRGGGAVLGQEKSKNAAVAQVKCNGGIEKSEVWREDLIRQIGSPDDLGETQ